MIFWRVAEPSATEHEHNPSSETKWSRKNGVAPAFFDRMRSAIILLAVLMVVVGTAKTTLACDCPGLSPEESLRRADLVFEGKVVRTAELHHRTAYTFVVHKVLKGSVVSEVTITGTGTNCDDYFSPDVIYRVHARRFEDRLITSQCSGNKVLKTKKPRRTRATAKTRSFIMPASNSRYPIKEQPKCLSQRSPPTAIAYQPTSPKSIYSSISS